MFKKSDELNKAGKGVALLIGKDSSLDDSCPTTNKSSSKVIPV